MEGQVRFECKVSTLFLMYMYRILHNPCTHKLHKSNCCELFACCKRFLKTLCMYILVPHLYNTISNRQTDRLTDTDYDYLPAHAQGSIENSTQDIYQSCNMQVLGHTKGSPSM